MIKNADAWLSLTRLARELWDPEESPKPNPRALRRWRFEGLLTPAGERVLLPCKRRGGRWTSTWRLVQEFLDAVQGRREAAPTLPMPTRTECRRAVAEADQVLDRMRIGGRAKRTG